VLKLSGICLDSPALAASALLIHLTELWVSGLLLEQELTVTPGAEASGCFQQLRMLHVDQQFSMGAHQAKVLFPGLLKLSIVDSSSCR
jgi:hypothetical protein